MSTIIDQTAARDWLANADPDPGRIYRWWSAGVAASIETGQLFDVVRLADHLTPWVIAQLPSGPIMQLDSPPPHLYALVPPGSWPRFSTPLATLLGEGGYLAMVDPEIPSTGRPDLRWITPPDGTGRLVDPVGLRRLIDAYSPEQAR